MSKKVVLALSGGMDSATLLHFYLEQGSEVHAVSFNYGSKHNPYELKCTRQLVAHANQDGHRVKHTLLDITEQMKMARSHLMSGQGEIPEGHYEDASMKKTVVPGRNLIFAALLCSIAESEGAQIVALGVHSGDHAIYPDCRPEFIANLAATVSASTNKAVTVEAPFLFMDKSDILQQGIISGVPYQYTRTCYKEQLLSCGRCGSCRERLEAFENAGIKDPILYEVFHGE